MSPKERPNRRLTLGDADHGETIDSDASPAEDTRDRVDRLDRELREINPVSVNRDVESLDDDPVPALDIAHVHDEALAAATEDGLNAADTRGLIRRRQQENHDRTKRQARSSLRDAVVSPESTSREDAARTEAERLSRRVDSIFTIEADETGESGLEREYARVLSIEAIADPERRATARRKYINALARRLAAKHSEAELIYNRIAASPEVYLAIKQQRQVLLLVEHAPDKYREFVRLSRIGDTDAVNALIASIEDDAVRARLQQLQTESLVVHEVVAIRRSERLIAARREFQGILPVFDSLSEERQLLLGQVAQQATPEFLVAMQRATLQETADGLEGRFLGRPLQVSDVADAHLGAARIREFSRDGLRDAAAVDLVRSQPYEVFEELTVEQTAGLLAPFFELDRIESLPVMTDLHRIQTVLDALGLRTSREDGWLILRELQLITGDGEPYRPGIRRLLRQLRELSAATEPMALDQQSLQKVLHFWQQEAKEPENSTILTASEVGVLPEMR